MFVTLPLNNGGNHALSILLNEEHVPRSPTTFFVEGPVFDRQCVFKTYINQQVFKISHGTIEFTVENILPEQEVELCAKVLQPSGSSDILYPVKVSEHLYIFTLVVIETGSIVFNVENKGRPIFNCPRKVMVSRPVLPKYEGPPTVKGKTIIVSFDICDVPSEKMTALCLDPDSNRMPLEVKVTQFKISLVVAPKKPGKYTFKKLYWGAHRIPIKIVLDISFVRGRLSFKINELSPIKTEVVVVNTNDELPESSSFTFGLHLREINKPSLMEENRMTLELHPMDDFKTTEIDLLEEEAAHGEMFIQDEMVIKFDTQDFESNFYKPLTTTIITAVQDSDFSALTTPSFERHVLGDGPIKQIELEISDPSNYKQSFGDPKFESTLNEPLPEDFDNQICPAIDIEMIKQNHSHPTNQGNILLSSSITDDVDPYDIELGDMYEVLMDRSEKQDDIDFLGSSDESIHDDISENSSSYVTDNLIEPTLSKPPHDDKRSHDPLMVGLGQMERPHGLHDDIKNSLQALRPTLDSVKPNDFGTKIKPFDAEKAKKKDESDSERNSLESDEVVRLIPVKWAKASSGPSSPDDIHKDDIESVEICEGLSIPSSEESLPLVAVDSEGEFLPFDTTLEPTDLSGYGKYPITQKDRIQSHSSESSSSSSDSYHSDNEYFETFKPIKESQAKDRDSSYPIMSGRGLFDEPKGLADKRKEKPKKAYKPSLDSTKDPIEKTSKISESKSLDDHFHSASSTSSDISKDEVVMIDAKTQLPAPFIEEEERSDKSSINSDVKEDAISTDVQPLFGKLDDINSIGSPDESIQDEISENSSPYVTANLIMPTLSKPPHADDRSHDPLMAGLRQMERPHGPP